MWIKVVYLFGNNGLNLCVNFLLKIYTEANSEGSPLR